MSESPTPAPTGDPWAAFGYLVSGALLYGGLGYVMDRWLGTSFLVPVGFLFGIGLALFMVFKRYLNA